MPKVHFEHAVEEAVRRDSRYASEAYFLVRDALNFTVNEAKRKRGGEVVHVRGPELCEGFREYALQQFGPMVPTLLEMWGIQQTRDIGAIVFNLIDTGVFFRSEDDHPDDFANIYSFHEAFVAPFLPKDTGTANAHRASE